jgi:transcription elongation factor SPT4
MKGSPDRIGACTTAYFDGIISIVDPEASWVARWQRTCECHSCFPVYFSYCHTAKYVRGMYAVRVKGRIPEDVEAELDSRGIKYRPRDQTDQD